MYISRRGVRGSNGSYIFNFWGTSTLFSIAATKFYISTNRVQKFQFFHIFTSTFFCFDFLDNSYTNRCEAISHYDFKWISLMVNDIEHLFICLLAICMSSLNKLLSKPFAHFLMVICCFHLFGLFWGFLFLFLLLLFCYCDLGVPYTYWILKHYQIYGWQIFSPIL